MCHIFANIWWCVGLLILAIFIVYPVVLICISLMKRWALIHVLVGRLPSWIPVHCQIVSLLSLVGILIFMIKAFEQVFLILVKSNVLTFSLLWLLLSKKSCLRNLCLPLGHKGILLYFSESLFFHSGLCFILNSFLYMYILVWGRNSSSLFFHVIFQHHLLKRFFFLY